MNSYLNLSSILFVFFYCATGFTYAQTTDTCDVKEYVRHDGLMMRGMEYETVCEIDSVHIMCAMYAIDKEYFFILHIDNAMKLMQGKKLNDNLSIQFSDSTVVLLVYNSNRNQSSKKTYDGYFKIQSKDLGYIEKYQMVRINYTMDGQEYFLVTTNKDVLQRHFSCLVIK